MGINEGTLTPIHNRSLEDSEMNRFAALNYERMFTPAVGLKRFFDLTLIPHSIIFIYSLTSAAILHTKRLVEHLRKESSASSVRGTAIIRVVAN